MSLVDDVLCTFDGQAPADINDPSRNGTLQHESERTRSHGTSVQVTIKERGACESEGVVALLDSALGTYRSDFLRFEPKNLSLFQYEPPAPPRFYVLAC